MQAFKIKIPLLMIIFGSITGCTSNDSSSNDNTPTMPHFSLIDIDSVQMTRSDLVKGKQTLIVFFSPDCRHCEQLTHNMLTNIKKLKDVQILMTTYHPLNDIISFSKRYGLEKYANIKVGRDFKFFFIPFYKITKIPFVALYDQRGELVSKFEGGVSVSTILKYLN